MRLLSTISVIVLAFGAMSFAAAPDSAPAPDGAKTPPAAEPQLSPELQKVLDAYKSLKYQKGTVALKDLATARLNDNFLYLDAANTEVLLTKVWGNPKANDPGSLGAIVPVDPPPISEHGWIAVAAYEDTGYVSDKEAGTIDYAKLMRDMQSSAQKANEERKKAGFDEIHLLGWAREPYYDKAAHKMYWAKRISFGDDARETLNYEIRVLGRNGVLDLNIVAPMADLASIDGRATSILSMVSFNPGHAYSDFSPGRDKVAAFGLAGLIAGGALAAKAGLFKGLLVALLAAKKFILIGLVAVAAFFRQLWNRLRGKKAAVAAAQAAVTPPDATLSANETLPQPLPAEPKI